jgi:hypothetical protein
MGEVEGTWSESLDRMDNRHIISENLKDVDEDE